MAPPWGNRPTRRKVGWWLVLRVAAFARATKVTCLKLAGRLVLRVAAFARATKATCLKLAGRLPAGFAPARGRGLPMAPPWGNRPTRRKVGRWFVLRVAAFARATKATCLKLAGRLVLRVAAFARATKVTCLKLAGRLGWPNMGNLWVGTEWVIRLRRNDGDSPRSAAGCRRRWPRVPSSGEERAEG